MINNPIDEININEITQNHNNIEAIVENTNQNSQLMLNRDLKTFTACDPGID